MGLRARSRPSTRGAGRCSLALAGLTFAVAMAYRNKKVPRALAWLGLVSYSVYLRPNRNVSAAQSNFEGKLRGHIRVISLYLKHGVMGWIPNRDTCYILCAS